MGNVNSQGLTWLEWRNAAGFNHPIDSWVWNGLRNAWKAGVDPAEYRANPELSSLDPELVAAVKAGKAEYNRRHGR